MSALGSIDHAFTNILHFSSAQESSVLSSNSFESEQVENQSAQTEQMMECSVTVSNEINIEEMNNVENVVKESSSIVESSSTLESSSKKESSITTTNEEHRFSSTSENVTSSSSEHEIKLEETVKMETLQEDESQTIQEELIKNPKVNFPTIPSIFKYLEPTMETRSCSPMFCPSKKNPKEDMLGLGRPLKPEFNYAVGDRQIENLYSETTASKFRTIQSEMFESQGHFNARSRTVSPYPVFQPKETGVVPESRKEKSEERQPTTKILIEKLEPKNPLYEEHIKNLVMTTGKEKSETLLLQKGCFNELEEIKLAYNIADDLTDDISSEQVTETGGNISSFAENKNEILVPPKDFRNAETSFDPPKQNGQKDDLNLTETQIEKNGNELKQVSSKEISPDSERPKFKKAPDAVIGARPLFGELNLNSEFQKAIISRQKSIKSKRSRNTAEKANINVEPKIKVEKTEYSTQEKLSEDTKLATEFKKTEVAQIEKLYSTETDEIEKIYYQQEREFNLDIQTVGNENITAENIESIIRDTQHQLTQPGNFTIDKSLIDINQHISECNSADQSEDPDYVKVPVKSLIRCFEESTMPTMKYKQLREPLPDVVEKLGTTRSSNVIMSCNNESIMHSDSKTDCVNQSNDTFYVAQSQVQTSYLSPDPEKMQNIMPSENSSFCRYVSPPAETEEASSFYYGMQTTSSFSNLEQQFNGKAYIVFL